MNPKVKRCVDKCIQSILEAYNKKSDGKTEPRECEDNAWKC